MTSDTREAEALAANDAFYASFNHKDIEAMSAVWADRPDITCIHPGWNVLRGRDQVIDSWRAILANPQQPRIVVGGAVALMTDDAAVVICRELVSGSPLAATNVFVLQNSAWRLLHHQSGPVASLAQ